MGQYIINLAEDEERILKTDIANIDGYIQNVIQTKLNSRINIVFEYFSDKQARKVSKKDKIEFLKDKDLDEMKPVDDQGEDEQRSIR
jgi:uncharacterized membrane protein